MQMLEDQTTIEKSSKLIIELANKDDGQSKNQLARWVSTKNLMHPRFRRSSLNIF
jgi:hypothetical protein